MIFTFTWLFLLRRMSEKKNGEVTAIPLLLIPFKMTGSTFNIAWLFIYLVCVSMPFSCMSCLVSPPQYFVLDLSHINSVHFCLPTSSTVPLLLFAMHTMPSWQGLASSVFQTLATVSWRSWWDAKHYTDRETVSILYMYVSRKHPNTVALSVIPS